MKYLSGIKLVLSLQQILWVQANVCCSSPPLKKQEEQEQANHKFRNDISGSVQTL